MSTQLLDLTQLKPIPPQSAHLHEKVKQQGYTLLGYAGNSKYAVEDAEGNQRVLSVRAFSEGKTRKANHNLTGALGETAGELVITDKFNPEDRGLSLEAVRTMGRKVLPKEVLEVHCSCGEVIYCDLTWWRNRGSRSNCGIPANHKVHGMGDTSLFRSWRKMRARCNNEKEQAYRFYGARGIRVCPEWDHSEAFPVFMEWALAHGWEEGMEINRIDHTGNYCPDNCEWVTKHDNLMEMHKRVDRTKYITIRDVTLPQATWLKLSGITPAAFHTRMKMKGMSEAQALALPKSSRAVPTEAHVDALVNKAALLLN